MLDIFIMATMKWGKDRMTEGETQKVQDQCAEESGRTLTGELSLSHYMASEHYHPQYTLNITEGIDTSL